MPMGIQYEVSKDGRMAEWSIASDLKSDELYRFREFESHSFLMIIKKLLYFFFNQLKKF